MLNNVILVGRITSIYYSKEYSNNKDLHKSYISKTFLTSNELKFYNKISEIYKIN